MKKSESIVLNLCEHNFISFANVSFVYFGIFHIHAYSNIQVMPEKYFCGRRPPFPLCNKNVNIIVGEPLEFDLPRMRQTAISTSRDLSLPTIGWPSISPNEMDEAAQRCLYATISEQIRTAMESLRIFSKSFQAKGAKSIHF